MKLKYKKIIILISMCTMGIGLVTFSMSGHNKKSSTEVEGAAVNMVAYNPQAVDILDSQSIETTGVPSITPMPSNAPSTKTTLTAEATESTESTEVVVSSDPLEKNAHQDINTLIKKYFNAKLTNDKEKFKSLVNDVSYLDLDDMARKTKYIEKYKNIVCYTKKGPEDGSYIVYVYHEYKFTGIKTLAPAMNEFYVKTNEEGKPYIFLGKISKDDAQYLNVVRESEDVMTLIYDVNAKMQKVAKKDSELDKFYEKLKESAQKVTKNENN